MSVVGQGPRGDDIEKRAQLRAALEAGDQAAAVEIARRDLAVVRNFANDMLKEIKPQLSLAARRAAVLAAPEDPGVHREMMRALILARKVDELIEHARAAPFDEPTLRGQFRALAEEFFDERRPKQAIAVLQAMQKLLPMDTEAERMLLKVEILGSRPEDALERLNGFDLAPQERAALLQQLAERFDAAGDKRRALNCRHAAAALVPQNFAVVFAYLRALKSIDADPERIIEALKDDGLRAADKERLLRELASEEHLSGSNQIALRRAAAERTPENVTIVQEYVRTVLKERGFDSALAALDHPALDRADRVQVFRDLGGVLAKAREIDLALRCKAEAYDREPERVGVLYELLEPLMKQQGPAGTRAYFAAKGVSTDTLLATLRHFIALLVQGDRIDLAVPAWRTAAHLSPQSPELVVDLALTAMRWRGVEQAIAEIDGSELSEAERIRVLKMLADSSVNEISSELAAACRAEASRRDSEVP